MEGKTMRRINSYEEFVEIKSMIESQKDSKVRIISICGGAGCLSKDGSNLVSLFRETIEKSGLSERVEVKLTGCHGICSFGPSVIIYPEEICYLKVKGDDVKEIVDETIAKERIVERLLYEDGSCGKVAYLKDIPFYKKQTRHILGFNTKIDPTSIEDYIAHGGYAALAKALFKMSPEKVLEEVKKANLRGRGGGGFPAGQKWETTRNAKSDIKYVIVNGHEGEPGAYMDRAILGGNPHIVLEGLIIGAYAIGASQGFIYLRHDAPNLKKNIETAIDKAKKYGFLGKNIMGSGFDFDVEVHLDIGIFVSGESSALMRSIEGRIPEPRPKYIRTSISGIFEKPSNLNNVETWANVPLIIERGAEWYSKIGTERSKGTKLISLSGKIKNAGVIEVPFGVSLREIVYEIGGGLRDGKELKAVHFGSAMGGSIPREMIDTPLDFDECAKLGAPIGAGGLLVLDETDDILGLVSYFLDFLSTESCGKCVPCREGIRQIRKLLSKIKEGIGTKEDVEKIKEICEVQRKASLCALGRSASSPIETAFKYFWNEFESRLTKEK
jgi:NADH-quinone oxidoreductase subunit F